MAVDRETDLSRSDGNRSTAFLSALIRPSTVTLVRCAKFKLSLFLSPSLAIPAARSGNDFLMEQLSRGKLALPSREEGKQSMRVF